MGGGYRNRNEQTDLIHLKYSLRSGSPLYMITMSNFFNPHIMTQRYHNCDEGLGAAPIDDKLAKKRV